MAKKIFISHRNVGEDLQLAQGLHAELEERGHRVFLDAADIRPGDDWPARIKEELEAADLVVLLMSRALGESPDMVAEELSMAKALHREHGRPRIVPVSMEADVVQVLPYDLRAKISRIQHESWAGEDDTLRLALSLDRVAREAEPVRHLPRSESRAITDCQPPAGDRSAPEPDDDQPPPQPPTSSDTRYWYVSRPRAEQEAASHLAQHGSPVVLVGPENIGKSYFLNYLLRTSREPEDGEVRINLEYLGDAVLESLDDLFKEFAYEFIDQLGLDDGSFEKAWQRRRPPARKLTHFLQRTALPAARGRFFLAIDRADAILETDFAQEVFGVLRRWAEMGNRGAPWERLRLLLAVSTEPSLLSQQVHQSPFNISEPIRLGDLTFDQVQELARRYRLDWTPDDLRQLVDLVGGHPYLVRQALYKAAVGGTGVGELLAEATAADGLFSDHLRSRLLKVRRAPELGRAVRAVLRSPEADVEFEIVQRLQRAGLLKGHPGAYALRYKLYEQYFREWAR